MKIQSLTGDWQFRRTGTEEWLPATVPGGVHTDLLALDRIPDPFIGDNEKRFQWVAEADWEYRLRFASAPELHHQQCVWLVCDGLDTLAAVTLNGHSLGRTNNMFRQYRWEVKELLREGDNEVSIAFASPVGYITEKQAIRALPTVYHTIAGGPYIRKSPHQFGWVIISQPTGVSEPCQDLKNLIQKPNDELPTPWKPRSNPTIQNSKFEVLNSRFKFNFGL